MKTTKTWSIPTLFTALESNQRPETVLMGNLASGTGGNVSRNILLIEDESDIRTILKDVLEWEGYRVYTASNGKEGLDILQQIPTPQLILLDLMMPVMNGWEFANALQADGAYVDIPILAVSAFSDLEKTIRAKGFIKKPVDLDLLLSLVKQHSEPGGIQP